MFDATVPCKKCHSKVPASHLKLDLDIGMMICPDCIKNKAVHKEIEKEAFHKEEKQTHAPLQSVTKREEPAESSRVSHKCTSCGFKFKVDLETRKPKNCPYCNSAVMGI